MRSKHKLTKREMRGWIARLKALQLSSDTEMAHAEADDILVCILTATGHKDIVAEYRRIKKWYA